ncbi:MAG: zinc transport system ATP-binding protein, partial [Thermodesulfobacteriota bacterium]|nr:zinc transport system ATP-binding protein [Thermodesulfobacteriota bacterium]
MLDAPAIVIDDLWFSYDGHDVLESVSLKVMPQEFTCMVGPNGGGKTTMLKLILGLL